MATKERSVPGYYIFDELLTKREKVKHDITVGLYYLKGGGCDCEGALEYEEFQYNETSPFGPSTAKVWTLKFYDDCWAFLHRFAKLHKVLAETRRKDRKKDWLHPHDYTLPEMEAMLQKAGFRRLYTDSQLAAMKKESKS